MKTYASFSCIKENPVIEKIKINQDFISDIVPKLAGLKDSAILVSSLNSDIGRFSYVGLEPFLIFKSKGKNIQISSDSGINRIEGDPFLYLNDLIQQNKINNPTKLPFIGGAVGYFSYDLKNSLEKLPQSSKDDLGIADIYFVFYRALLIYDNHKPDQLFISALESKDGKNAASGIIAEIKKSIHGNIKNKSKVKGSKKIYPVNSNFSQPGYLKAINKIINYIYEGDVFQINLSQRFKTRWIDSGKSLFNRLNKINPSPFGAYLNLEGFEVVSSSPELFLKYDSGVIETRPMKGTRRRCLDLIKNKKAKEDLISSAKDDSELSMIVDLERNDLGKVCVPGSVKVCQHRKLEEYSTVFQTVSVVRGMKNKKAGVVDVIKAVFPGGSITGCPKIRAMEIIDELEPHTRGIYTGSIGYLSFHDTMQFSIAIRTIILKNGYAYFHAGGGIVADSNPKDEYRETLDKACALMRALGCEKARGEKWTERI